MLDFKSALHFKYLPPHHKEDYVKEAHRGAADIFTCGTLSPSAHCRPSEDHEPTAAAVKERKKKTEPMDWEILPDALPLFLNFISTEAHVLVRTGTGRCIASGAIFLFLFISIKGRGIPPKKFGLIPPYCYSYYKIRHT